MDRMSSPGPTRQGAPPPRPRQVTLAVVMSIVFSIVLVVSLFDTLARLRTPATRASVDEVLASPPSSELGLETAQVIDVLRAMAFASGALAAMAVVFAIFILQRHRAARIGFTVTAGLMLLTVPAAGLFPVFLTLAAIPLWSRPARDWYAGRSPAPAAVPVPLLSEGPHGGQGDPYPGPGPQQPDPGREPLYGPPGQLQPGQLQPGQAQPGQLQPGQAPGQPQSGPPPYGRPYGEPGAAPRAPDQPGPDQPHGYQPGYAQPAYGSTPVHAPRDPGKRPVTVTVASVITWVGAGLTAALMLLFLLVLAVSSDAFVEEFENASRNTEVTFSADQAMALGWTVGVVVLVWSITAIVLAVLAFRRSNAARIALVVSAAMTALLSLLAIMSVISIVTLLMAGATLVLLFTGGANEWYSRRGGPSGGAPYAGHGDPWVQQPATTPGERPKPW